MTTVALITTTTLAIVQEWGVVPPMVHIPGLGDVHGVQIGWTSPDGAYKLVDVVHFVPPQGQMITGNPSYTLSGSTLTETYATVPLPPPSPQQAAASAYNDAIAAGIILTWSSSTTLSGTYAIDPATMDKLNSTWTVLMANNFFPNGTALQPWYKMDGTKVQMGSPQFKNFGTALSKYVAQLGEARDSQAAGGSPTWPSNAVSITG